MPGFLLQAHAFDSKVSMFRAYLPPCTEFPVGIREQLALFYDRLFGVFTTLRHNARRNVKISFCATVEMRKASAEQSGEETIEFTTRAPTILLAVVHDVGVYIDQILEAFCCTVECEELEGSGWSFSQVLWMDLELYTFKSGTGGCLPLERLPSHVQHLVRRGVLLHPTGNEMRCFSQAIHMLLGQELNTEMLSFPVNPHARELDRFEKVNHLRVHIYSLHGTHPFCVRVSDMDFEWTNVPLLLIGSNIGHYLSIPNLSLFVRNLGTTRTDGSARTCHSCLSLIRSEKACRDHEKGCFLKPPQVNEFYPDHERIEFKEGYKREPHSYVCYCDIEALLDPNTTSSFGPNSNVTNQHKPVAAAGVLVGGWTIPCLLQRSITVPLQ